MTRPDLAPKCGHCHRRHDPGLRCWIGRYAKRVTDHIMQMQGRTCWMCGGAATTTDHVIPRSRWGDDSPENCRPACGRCNSRRGNRLNPFDHEQPNRLATGLPLSQRWRT